MQSSVAASEKPHRLPPPRQLPGLRLLTPRMSLPTTTVGGSTRAIDFRRRSLSSSEVRLVEQERPYPC